MNKRIVLWAFLMLFYFKGNTQCAMCRAVLETEQGQEVAKGMNDGIVYLMAIPYILIAGIGFLIYKKFKGSKKAE